MLRTLITCLLTLDADAFQGASASLYFSELWAVDRRGAMATCSIIHQSGQDPCFPLIALLLF